MRVVLGVSEVRVVFEGNLGFELGEEAIGWTRTETVLEEGRSMYGRSNPIRRLLPETPASCSPQGQLRRNEGERRKRRREKIRREEEKEEEENE